MLKRIRKPKVLIVCGGRLAGLLYSMFRDDYHFIGYIDDVFPCAYIEKTYGLRKLGTSADLPRLAARDIQAVIAVTDVAARRKYHSLLHRTGFSLITLIAKTAIVSGDATIGKGCIIRHNAIISAQVHLGDNAVVSDNAYIGHDSIVGENVYIAPGVCLNGSVTIGDNSFIGTGAVVLPGLTVGRECMVGAAACVSKNTGDNETVAGVPARSLHSAPQAPLVSVVMASYNHEKYVCQAIESVLAQTFRDIEFIIIDDGSDDRTADMIRKYDDPMIKAQFSKQNRGAIYTKNKCLDMARGKYIAILNSDDAFMPAKLEKQVAFLEGNPNVGVVLTDVSVIDDDGKPFTDKKHFYYKVFSQPNRSRFEWLRHFFYEGNCLCIPSALIRRECYDVVGRPDSRYLQLPDLDFWIRICFRYEIHIFQEKLTQFRVRSNGDNASSSKPENMRRVWWEYSKILHRYRTICNEKELLAIFPEAMEFTKTRPVESDMIPYVVARLALAAGESPHMSAFALDTLFELLAEPGRGRRLYEEYAFGYKEFIELTGKRIILK
jgi:sugar O-acyltransferase (sialic acid O-acetyltransferase NeuD family)